MKARYRILIAGTTLLIGLLALLIGSRSSAVRPCLEPWTSDEVWLQVLLRDPRDAPDFEQLKEEMLEKVMRDDLNRGCSPAV